MKAFTLTACAAALMMAACSGEAVSTVQITLSEFEINTSSDHLVAGPIDLSITNEGDETHVLLIEGADGTVIAGHGPVPSGETVQLQVDLNPGRYLFTCRIVEIEDGEMEDHAEIGMSKDLSVSST